MKTYRVGSRASALAMTQTRTIIAWLKEKRPEAHFEIVEITTHGDRFRDTPITQMGNEVERGIFNSALEAAVLAGEVDFATCSFKDVESDLPHNLTAVTVGPREDTRDVLVSRLSSGLGALPQHAVLATSSPRRTSQLTALRPDLKFEPLRGNINTRVEERVNDFDGIILAAAGLYRLGLEKHIAEHIPHEVLLPAPAQGALGCEYASDRPDVAELIALITEPQTEMAVRAEKKLLVTLSGGCFAPIGAYAHTQGDLMHLQGRVVSLDGNQRAEAEVSGPWNTQEAIEELVANVAQQLRDNGAQPLVDAAREHLLNIPARKG